MRKTLLSDPQRDQLMPSSRKMCLTRLCFTNHQMTQPPLKASCGWPVDQVTSRGGGLSMKDNKDMITKLTELVCFGAQPLAGGAVS